MRRCKQTGSTHSFQLDSTRFFRNEVNRKLTVFDRVSPVLAVHYHWVSLNTDSVASRVKAGECVRSWPGRDCVRVRAGLRFIRGQAREAERARSRARVRLLRLSAEVPRARTPPSHWVPEPCPASGDAATPRCSRSAPPRFLIHRNYIIANMQITSWSYLSLIKLSLFTCQIICHMSIL